MINAKIEVLGKSEIEDIHNSTLEILDKTGLVFHSEDARLLMQFHGARLDRNRVYIPPGLVEKALKACPPGFTLKSRNPQKDVIIGNGIPALEATRGSIYITDSFGQRRKATTDDFLKLTKLVQTSDVINLNCAGITNPVDISQHALPAFSMICSALYTDKPLPGLTLNEAVARECLHLAETVYEGLEANMVLGTICPISPLTYDTSDLKAAYVYAQSDQPLCVTSCGMAGTTTPPTLAATLAVNNAEILAGIILVQLIREGTPVVYGNLSSVTDMRHINMATGAPEGMLLQLAAKQVARYYNLPFRGGGALNDAKSVDVQAGYESMMNLILTMISGFDYVPHAIGVLDSYMSISYEKFIIDESMVMAVKRLLRGIEVSNETMLTSLVEKVGPGGNYLTSDETAFFFRLEYWQPAIDARQPFKTGNTTGTQDFPGRAMDVCLRRLGNYSKPGLPSHVEATLVKYFKDHYGQAETFQLA